MSSAAAKAPPIAFGIDLGTTNTCIAVAFAGGVKAIPNEQSDTTTPSCVAWQNGEERVGKEAKDQSYKYPLSTGQARIRNKHLDKFRPVRSLIHELLLPFLLPQCLSRSA